MGQNSTWSAYSYFLPILKRKSSVGHTHVLVDVEQLPGDLDDILSAIASKAAAIHTHIPSEVGLSNVPNVNATIPTNISQTAGYRFVTDTEKGTWNGKQNALGYTAENVDNKGAINGYAGLDSTGRVYSAQLPSYVDDVLEGTLSSPTVFLDALAVPYTASKGIIYVDTGTDKEYRWTGTQYREISPSPGSTDAIAEGSANLYFTVARVRAVLLTGLDLSTNAAITAADTILSALGKLQKQITDILPLLPTAGQKQALVGNGGTPGTGNEYITKTGLLQSDWNQVTNTAQDYIKNKPYIPTGRNNAAAINFKVLTLSGSVVSAGNVTFYLTDTGLVGGTAVFANIYTMLFRVNDSTVVCAFQTTISTNLLTVNVKQLSLLGLAMNNAANGTTIQAFIIGA